jgi:hypothetical protein
MGYFVGSLVTMRSIASMQARGRSALASRLSSGPALLAGFPATARRWEGHDVASPRSYFTTSKGEKQTLFSRMRPSTNMFPALNRAMSSLPSHVPLSMPALSPTMTAGNIGNQPNIPPRNLLSFVVRYCILQHENMAYQNSF